MLATSTIALGIAAARGFEYMRCRAGALMAGVRTSLPTSRSAPNASPGGAKDEVACWRLEAVLGSAWRFGCDDMPHFVHLNGRWWLVRDEVGRWEAWVGHRAVGRFATIRDAKAGLFRSIGY